MLSVPPKTTVGGAIQLHATTVTIGSKALALVGPGGSGKSSTAVRLLTLGAKLLADDITHLHQTERGLIAQCPEPLQNQIEVRGLGILHADASPPSLLHTIVDLGRSETDRIPLLKSVDILGHAVPVLHKFATPYFAEALYHYMKFGRYQGTDSQP